MFYKETEFQDSPVGKVPRDWDVRELGDERIAKIIAGQSPPSSTYSNENHGLPFLQGKTEFGEMFPSPTVYCSKPIKVAQKNDILLSVRAPVGDVNIAPFECCIGRGIAAIRPRTDKLASMFLFHYLRLEGKRFEALSTGSTFKAIRRKEIEKFQVLVPPSIEQSAIVGVLGVVDSAIELADNVIAKTERLKKGLMQQLLTRGIGHTEYKDTPIGKIPKAWEIKSLENACTTIVDCQHTTPKFTTKGFLVVRNFNIRNGELIFDPAYYTTEEEWKKRTQRCVPENEDVLFSREAPVGEASLAPKNTPFSLGQRTMLLRTDKRALSPLFLVYTFYSPPIRLKLRNLEAGVTAHHVNVAEIRRLRIPLPPLAEQERIANIILTASDKLKLEKKEKTKLELLKKGLMDLLLTGKIRIKVN
jgi:type I restriction enzyme S subunit